MARIFDPEMTADLLQVSLTERDPDKIMFESVRGALDVIRRGHRTTSASAYRALYEAVDAGKLVVVKASVSGKHLSRLAPNTLPDSRSKYMWDVLSQSETSRSGTPMFVMDNTGIVYPADPSSNIHNPARLPDGVEPAIDDSQWVTTPAQFVRLLHMQERLYSEWLTLLESREKLNDAFVESRHADALPYFYALVKRAGLRPHAVETHVSNTTRDNEPRVVLTLRLRDREIRKVADVLKDLGLNTEGGA